MTARSANFAVPVRRIDRLIIVLCAICTAMLVVFGGHLAAMADDQQRMQDYAERLLQRSVDISAVVHETLQHTPPPATPCDDADLENLRRIVFLSPYLRDMGRRQGDQILCSATWGQLAENATRLPPPQRVTENLSFWHAIPHPADPLIRNDLTATQDTFAVTSPTAYQDFLLPTDGVLSAQLSSRDGQHLRQRFGPTSSPALPTTTGMPNSDTRLCHNTYDACVTAQIAHLNLLSDSPATLLGLTLLGLLSGAGAGCFLVTRFRRQRSLSAQLTRAVNGRGLSLAFQPLRALADRTLVGAEALARWRNEQGEWVPPDVFIPLAEQQGLIQPLTRQVLKLALAEMRDRLRDNSGFYLSLNVSVEDLLSPDFHTELERQVQAAGIQPQRIVLEMTERANCELDGLSPAIERLRRQGFRCYLDDFGTGYANLSTLTQVPIDGLKIDKLFVHAIETEAPTHAVAAKICSMADELQIGIVVEGIEEEHQAAYMRKLAPGAIGQGWLFGRPVPIHQFPAR